ncbi:TetR/AcrR family transcriptional regulator [Streptomyces sp. CB01881]|uniref:TetR/AcrR family transcriptional regulator n=1 Tax=Streptomyces sp. CB01881 TaxID=2078691 RepID=UPI000CDC3635|nr:TetR/AcrR family transcriptional regulator [Streptomyces sp. CB01881]AUY53698.1 TetR family transcriptional regulator [Streptomyces sp. CB01881]TYC68708.1 TetR/AcrR family transcriptional regulator [Streptomyces sp. CB01881]
MDTGQTQPPARRRDARRNRELLIAAAHEVYSEQGVEAPLDVIARRAGVGNATLYRHFPTKAALVEEVFREALDAIRAAGEEARFAASPWAGFTGYLDQVFALLAADRGAGDLMTTGLAGVPSLEALHLHNLETVTMLIGRAQEDGTVRGDITPEDLLVTLAALGRVAPALGAAGPCAWRRYLALFLDGLRTEAAHPLPAPSLTSAQLGSFLGELGGHAQKGDGSHA